MGGDRSFTFHASRFTPHAPPGWPLPLPQKRTKPQFPPKNPAQPKVWSGVCTFERYIKIMTNSGRLLMGALGILVLWTGLRVIATETSGGTPYQGIVDRNVFGLKAPAPPPDPEANKPPPPKITLQGITTFGGIKRALFKVQIPPKPGDPAKGEQSFILAEGQRDGDIEVLEIDPKPPGSVKVNNFGTIVSLNFENNGMPKAGGSGPGAQPGPPGFVPPPAPNNPFGAGGPKAMALPQRPIRPPQTGMESLPGSYGGTANSGGYSTTRGQNTYTALPTASSYSPAPGVVMSGGMPNAVTLPGMASMPATTARQQNWPPETPMSPEEATLKEALWTTQHQKEISQGLLPSIPGSNPLLDNGNPPGQTTPKTY